MKTTPERSVEEKPSDEMLQFIGSMSLKQGTPVKIGRTSYFSVDQIVEAVTELLQAERQKREEMVREARKEEKIKLWGQIHNSLFIEQIENLDCENGKVILTPKTFTHPNNPK